MMRDRARGYRRYLEWFNIMIQLEDKMNIVAKRYDLNFNQYLLLKKVAEEHCNEPTQLAAAFGVSSPAMSRKLNSLAKSGKITKQRNNDEDDQRKVMIELTVKGEYHLAQLNRAYQELFTAESDMMFEKFDVPLFDEVTKQMAMIIDHLPKE